jgi:phage-related minor tail protein
MTSALDRFVSTGKLSFKDLTRSIIQDMIRIQLRAQMISLFSSMFNFAGAAAVSSYSATGGISESVFNPRARANGGPVNAGMPYMVGERGPEIIVPRTNGTVIPNHAMSSMGSTTNVTNNYINAIDVKSFETKLLESSNTIWAGYQYANKQLASNGRRA